MKYRMVKVEIWTDPWFEMQSPEIKLLYQYLMTSPLVNNAGLLKISDTTICRHTSLPITALTRAIESLKRDKKILRKGEWLWLKNFIKHQTSTSPKISKSISFCLEDCSDKKLVATVLKIYSQMKIPYRYPMDTLSIPYPELE